MTFGTVQRARSSAHMQGLHKTIADMSGEWYSVLIVLLLATAHPSNVHASCHVTMQVTPASQDNLPSTAPTTKPASTSAGGVSSKAYR